MRKKRRRSGEESTGRREKRVQEIEGINALYATLIQLGRQEEIMKATTDENYRKKLLEEFNIG